MKLFTKEIDKKLFDQYSKGNNLESQMVVAKIFNPYGRGTWYIVNSDPEDSDYLWAIVDLFEVEIGSVLRSELESIKVPPFRLGLERDTSFRPINAKELYDGLRNGKHYAHGGSIEDENREMVLNENNQIIHHTKELPSAIKGKRVPAWVVTKVHESASDLSDATHYMDGQKMAKGGGVEGVDLSKYEDIETLEYLYKLDNKWYASGFKMKHNAIGVGYTKAKALEDLDNHLSYVTSERYAKGGGIGTLSSSETNPKESIKKLGFDLVGKTNYSTSENGINYYVATKKEKAIVVAFIEDEDNYMIDKKDAREMSLSAKIKGIEIVELYTNYGIELRSSEKAKDIGFDKIYKIQLEDKFSEGGAVGNEIDFEYEYAGKSKLKASGEIVSKNGDYYKVKVTKGLMKGKTTDVHKSMIINKMADGGEIDTNVEMIEDKDGSQYLFPKNSKNKTLGVKFANGGDIESLNAPNSYLNIFTLGVKLPSQEKIVSSSMSPSHFSRKSLTLTLKGGSKEVIPEAKISDFLKGKQIDLRDTNGESYAIQLNRLEKMAMGGSLKGKIFYVEGTYSAIREIKNRVSEKRLEQLVMNGGIGSLLTFDSHKEADEYYAQNSIIGMGLATQVNILDRRTILKAREKRDSQLKTKMAKGGTLSKSQLKHFKEWMEDGNVSKNNDGTYSTQDAQYRNKLKDLNELKKYFKKEFAVDEYDDGGSLTIKKKYDISDFEMNKSILKKNMTKSGYYTEAKKNPNQADSIEALKTIDLLNKKTTKYTLEELLDLSQLMTSSSQEMYVDSSDDFLPMVVANAQKSIDKQKRVQKNIKELLKEEQSENIKSGDVHVKINEYFTATIRNFGSLKRLLKDEKVDKSLLEIVSVNNNPSQEFIDEVQNIIDNYKKRFEKGGNVGKYYEVEYEINGKKHKSTYMLYPSDKVEKMLPPIAKIISIIETNKKAKGGDIDKTYSSAKTMGKESQDFKSEAIDYVGGIREWNKLTEEEKRQIIVDLEKDWDRNKYKKGGNVNKVAKVMHEFKEGNLHSGKSEKIVTNPKQAIAIALSEAKNNSEKKGWKHKK